MIEQLTQVSRAYVDLVDRPDGRFVKLKLPALQLLMAPTDAQNLGRALVAKAEQAQESDA